MKRIISVIAAMLILVMMLSLAACSEASVQTDATLPGSTEAPAPAPTVSDIDALVGTYKLTSMSSGGETYEGDKLNSTGVGAELVVNADKTAVFTMSVGEDDTDTTNLTVDTEKKTMTPVEDGSTPATYALEGDKLTLTGEDMTMVLTKQ